MKRKRSFVVILAAILVCLAGCNERKDVPLSQDSGVATSTTSMGNVNSAYQKILDSVVIKCQAVNPNFSIKLGTLYDMDYNGQDELFLLYEYPENYITFEIWTIQNNEVIQLAVVSDLPGIAGNGYGGIYAVQYQGDSYMCLWVTNNETNPPGVEVTFHCSLWQLTGNTLTNPRRLGVNYQLNNTEITEVFSSYGITAAGIISTIDCQSVLNEVFVSPLEVILCMPHGNDDYGKGVDFQEVLK